MLNTQVFRFYWLDLMIQGSMNRFSGIQMIGRLDLVVFCAVLLDVSEHGLLLRDRWVLINGMS